MNFTMSEIAGEWLYSHMSFPFDAHRSVSVCRGNLGKHARAIFEAHPLGKKGHTSCVFPWYCLDERGY